MLALLCVSSLALAAGHKLDGAKFGSKSSYFTVANQDTSSLEVRDIDNVTEAEAVRLRASQVGTDMLEGVSQRTGVQDITSPWAPVGAKKQWNIST